jgi:hypothetical protein
VWARGGLEQVEFVMGFGRALCVRSGRLEEFLNFSAGESAIDGA